MAQVLGLSENFGTMTFAEGLAFLERTKRQLDRFDTALPHPQGRAIDPQEAAEIRRMCDRLEDKLRRMLCTN